MKKILFVALALMLGLTSCVKDKIYPGISISVSYSPQEGITAADDVTVTATITCYNEFTAKVVYTVNSNSNEINMTNTVDDTYTAVIPAQADGSVVTFYVEASNDDGTFKSANKSYTVGAAVVDYTKLRLNELNGNNKFIEIYNSGNIAIEMTDVYIEKDNAQNWVGTSDVTIPAGGYLLLYSEDVLDTMTYPAELVFHSGLSAKKNVRIQLFTPAGESIDDFNLTQIELNGEAYGYPGNQAPASYSRNADAEWYYADATPGAVNVDGENIVLGLEGGVTPPAPTPDYTNIVLNELNGNGGAKYIELYNKGGLDLVLNGLYIMKDDKPDPVWTGDGTITVPAHGYVVLYSEDVILPEDPLYGTNYVFASGLSPKKTLYLGLFLADGTESNVFTRGTGGWGVTISDVSPMTYSRTPDAGDWKLAEATEGAANPATGDDIPQD